MTIKERVKTFVKKVDWYAVADVSLFVATAVVSAVFVGRVLVHVITPSKSQNEKIIYVPVFVNSKEANTNGVD